MSAARPAINWVEQGYVPDDVIRQGIRRLCKARLGWRGEPLLGQLKG